MDLVRIFTKPQIMIQRWINLLKKIGNIANYYKEQVESIIEKYEQELDELIEQNNCEIRMGLICKRN